jgi:isopropylmalate/homocitrate/citramalate synthase
MPESKEEGMGGYAVNSKLEARTDLWRISQHCFSEEIRSRMTLPEKLQLCDITLREGRQLPGVSLRRDEVLLIADKLVEAGVSMVQMHHDDPLEIEEVKKNHPDLIIEALVHPTAVLNPELAKKEVDVNFDHGADYTTLCFSFSPEQMCLFESMAGGRITVEEAIERAMGSVAYARAKAGPARKVGCLIQDCTRIPIERLAEVCGRLVDSGADMIKLDDINGMAIYPVYTYVVREMKRLLPGTEIGLHTHNDIGLATASLCAGVEGGADLIDACVNGLGERAHIAPLAEIAAVLQIYYGIDCGIKLDKMVALSRLVSDLMKWPMADTMPFVGRTAFSHLVEVHYCVPDSEEGFWAYLSMKPEMFGNKMHNLLGHYSGPWAVRAKARELGLTIPREREGAVVDRVRSEIRWRKRQLSNEEFGDIVAAVA